MPDWYDIRAYLRRNRIIRALRADPFIFREIRRDENANFQILCLILIFTVGSTLNGVPTYGWSDSYRWLLGSMVIWPISILAAYYIGSRFFKESLTNPTIPEVYRVAGFTSVTYPLFSLFDVPFVGFLLGLFSLPWAIYICAVATRETLDYRSTWKAFGVFLLVNSIVVAPYLLVIWRLGMLTE